MQRPIPPVLTVATVLLATGCERTITVAGAFFPAWLVCIVASLLLSSILHLVLFRSGLDPWLRPRGFVHAAMVGFFTLLFYLLFFRP